MAPKKLSDADRQDILKRYRQPEENTVTIANSYGVSTSTVSRILKQNLSEADYESLIQQKRSGKSVNAPIAEQAVIEQAVIEQIDLPGFAAPVEPPVWVPETLTPETLVPEVAEPQRGESKPIIPPPRRRQRQRSDDPASLEEFVSQSSQLELPSVTPVREDEEDEEEPDDERLSEFVNGSSVLEKPVVEKPIREKPIIAKRELEEIEAELGKKSINAGAPLAEDLDDEDLEDDDLEDDLDDEELDDEDDLEDGELPANRGFSTVQIQKNGFLQVLPLSDAAIPKTCYIVVDRSSELITRPLKDFAELGQIPEEEIQAKTLPVFDNHRVAKRFMRRMQRVVKVPDGKMFQKVRPYLQAKGITRLLIDGQVYSL